MYRLKFDRHGHAAGTVVYDLREHDFGAASMDTFLYQLEHVSVTTEPSGEHPFFTVPRHDLEPMS